MKSTVVSWLFTVFLIASCSQDNHKVSYVDISKVVRILHSIDTLLEMNVEANRIYNQEFVDEIKIIKGDSRYLNCGYVDPTYTEYKCHLKKGAYPGIYAVYNDSSFSEIEYRYEAGEDKKHTITREYYKGDLIFYSEVSNGSFDGLVLRFRRGGGIVEIMQFEKGNHVLTKEYDDSGYFKWIEFYTKAP